MLLVNILEYDLIYQLECQMKNSIIFCFMLNYKQIVYFLIIQKLFNHLSQKFIRLELTSKDTHQLPSCS